MNNIAIVFWSGTGNTEAMANLIAEGISAAGKQAQLIPSSSFDAAAAKNYPAIAFGCPSMGSEQLEESEFEPMWQGVKNSLSGKKVGLFGSYGWGSGEWMRTWEADCDSCPCTRVGEGVIACGEPDEAAAAACRALGEMLAK